MKKITRKVIKQHWSYSHHVTVFERAWPDGMEITLKNLERALTLLIPISEWHRLIHRTATGPLLKHYMDTCKLIADIRSHNGISYWQREEMQLRLIKECLCETVNPV